MLLGSRETLLGRKGTFTNITGATASTFTPTVAITQNTWYRRITTIAGFNYTSNVVKYEATSINHEDINYTRIHDVLTSGRTTWVQVDLLTIGNKYQQTTYFDGLGRPIQMVQREEATPASGTVWNDIVQPIEYDLFGRQPISYLPYTSSLQPGKFKNSAVDQQAGYYATTFGDNVAYGTTSFDGSPLNRPFNSKKPGTAWQAGPGVSQALKLNTVWDEVKRFTVQGEEATLSIQISPPGEHYPENSLIKVESVDELGKWVVTFTDAEGKLILKKVQLDDNIAHPYNGWICTYYIYDEKGRLLCEITPEGVNDLVASNWAQPSQALLENKCFIFGYDKKNRTIYKKQPGIAPLFMIYDKRDRLVLTQDGNQFAKSPTREWTAYLYDALDRPELTALYFTNTSRMDLMAAAANSIMPVLSQADLNNSQTTKILTQNYYDHYQFEGVTPFSATDATAATVVTPGSNVLPIAATLRTRSMPTGSKIRVLNNQSEQWLYSTTYYNEDGAVQQTFSSNIKTIGTPHRDVKTWQYAWSGRLLATASRHAHPGNAYDQFVILTRYTYDKVGQVTLTEQKFAGDNWRKVNAQTYTDLGRVATRRLSPDFNTHFAGIGSAGNGLERLDYKYNLHGTLIGINEDFALKTAGYNKWSRFFGIAFGYAHNPGGQLSQPARLNGQLSGLILNTQGDDQQRRYQYAYDNAGRLTRADFAQKANPVAAFSSTELNFSEGGTSGYGIRYNLNGDITQLARFGHVMGIQAPQMLDDLKYLYAGSKLAKVTDDAPAYSHPTSFNAGDFKDGNITAADDYLYDHNGNLTTDRNKKIQGQAITYNHLDKPEEINIEGKGTIKITYDATGAKLKREFISATGGGTKVTWYMGAYQYEEVVGGSNPQAISLSFIHFAEGRIRPITPQNINNGLDAYFRDGLLTLPNGQKGAMDYFITDHRSDVRMILTEEVQWQLTTATGEAARHNNQLELANFIFPQNTRVAKTEAPGWTTNSSNHITKLSQSQPVGTNQLLKVMAGDLISANTRYHYPSAVTNSNTPSPVGTVLSVLATAITGSATTTQATKAATGGINTLLSGMPAFTDLLQANTTDNSTNRPKAFLNIVFFDERFIFVPEASTKVRVSVAGDHLSPLVLSNIRVPRNGYCFIYVSNESPTNVFFDDVQVRHDRGRILEENHYYAYGLKISALSSKAFGGAQNAYQYQGDYSEFDDDLGWNDFMLRSYDPQIGRFLQWDPYDQFSSGYVGMGNDPANNVDPTGGIVPGLGCQTGSKVGNFLRAFSQAALLAIPTTSTVATVGSLTMRGLSFAGKLSENGKNAEQSSHAALGNGEGEAASAGSGGEETAGNGCPDCPPGYGPNPKPGKNPRPFYTGKNAAASFWAVENKNQVYEYSSLVYEVTSSNGTKLYSTTTPMRWPENNRALGSSPGLLYLMDKFKNLIPENAVIGHIHLHPTTSTRKHPSNTGFSKFDNDDYDKPENEKILSQYRLWVLGSTGSLHVKYKKVDYRTNESGKLERINIKGEMLGTGFDNTPDARKNPPCPCYQQ